MIDRITFSLPFALPSLNVRDRRHWRQHVKDKRAMYLEVLAATGGTRYLPAEPFERARVTVTRHSAGSLDPDSEGACCKSLLDVLCVPSRVHPAALGIIRDDSARHLELIVRQAPAKRGHGSTLVTIERLEGIR